MGRSKKNKRKNASRQQQQGPSRPQKKRRKMPSYWIQGCRDTQPPSDGEPYDIEVLVTRTELTDDYFIRVPFTATATNEDERNKTSPSTAVDISRSTKDSNEEVACPNEASKSTPLIVTLGNFLPTDDDLPKEALDPGDKSSPPRIGIKISNSAKRPVTKVYDYVDNFKPLPNGDCGDGIVNPHPKDQVPDKYWSQRRRLFTLFDKGIRLDKESWYSVTPEVIANHIARHLVDGRENVVVLDPFCGCGGNAIAFASQPEVQTVICVDLDVAKLEMAYHNACIYGVEKKLFLIHGNALDVMNRYRNGKLMESEPPQETCKSTSLPESIDVVFLSPPWGGIDYGNVGKDGFDLTCIKLDGGDSKQFDGEWLLKCAAKALGHKCIAYFLPKNINGVAFASSTLKAGYSEPIVIEQNVLNGKLKTVTAYLGLGGGK